MGVDEDVGVDEGGGDGGSLYSWDFWPRTAMASCGRVV